MIRLSLMCLSLIELKEKKNFIYYIQVEGNTKRMLYHPIHK